MATNCEDISAQMMDLLYGELSADARANVDAHVAGCASCRSELEGYEKTRAVARRGLDEEPPARARAAIMQAAAAHLAAQAQPARKAAAPDKVSFWDRLRARWVFPTFATVGAVAVFVVANRVFLNPERTLDRPAAVESHSEAPVPEGPAPAPRAAAPASSGLEREATAATPRFEEEAQAGARLRTRPKPAAASRAGDMKPAGDDALDGLLKDAPATGEAHAAKAKKKGGGGLGAIAEAPPPAKAEAPADKSRRDQPMDGRFAPPPPPREEGTTVKRKAPVSVAESSEKEADEGRASSTTARRAAPAARAPSQPLDDLLGGAAKPSASAGPGGLAGGGGAPRGKADGFGSGAAQAAPAAEAPARNEAAKRAVAAPAPAAEPAPAMAPPSPAPAPRPRLKKSAEYAPEEGYAAAGEDAQAKEEKKQANVRSNANDTLLQRAERLFADGRWSEAAAIYRELLRRDPHSDDAERWRRRLAAAETAEVNERNANLAEKRNAESARTRKPAAPAKASKAGGKAAAIDAAH